ncbi:uncharacterized [Tachysurus ichikawai]
MSVSSETGKLSKCRSPTLQPNMREMVLLVQATLQWHSMGEKQSSFLMLGDIFSLTFSASEEAEKRLSRERCLLLPLRPPPPPHAPTPPPPPPPLLLVLPALTIHPHSSHHSIAPEEGQPDCFLHPAAHTFPSQLSVRVEVFMLRPRGSHAASAELFCVTAIVKSSSQGSKAAGSFPHERYRVSRL